MSDVNANINIDIDSSGAVANLRTLEASISKFNRSITGANSAAMASQQAWNKQLLQSINSTGLFDARVVEVDNSVNQFTKALESNKLSLSQYGRYVGSQMPVLSRVFRREFDTIQQVAESRVKKIQTQYVALGKTVDGVTKAIASTPTNLQTGYSTDLAVASQRQQLFNRLIDDGSTKLLNWGKNTQWAGRQLMVGFTIPLAALGTVSAQTFMEIDKATLSLKRVYGDLSTSTEEIEKNTEAISQLGAEYTKYGISLADTIGIAAKAAATGAQNETLMAATKETLRFATLGQIEYQQALDTTISLQTAFGISNEDLANKIDFLNAVENQTILTIEDMSVAIPRVATVIKGLGGSVEDLAVMMTAMREGGVSAENAANGLKSGLASLINPTNRATESLSNMGINITEIVNKNKGDLMGLITDFANATNALDEFSRQQVFEQVFGKYQYARMSALFTNITDGAGQAARAMDLAGRSAEELGAISSKELNAISETTSVKFQAAMENLKVSIAPLGEAFLKGITPVIEVITKIAELFNNLPDPVKNAIAVITAAVAGIGPVILMSIGLIGNGIANIVKAVQFFRKMLASVRGDASAFEYLASSEIEALTATQRLSGGISQLNGELLIQKNSVNSLANAYYRFATAANIASNAVLSMPGSRLVAGSRSSGKQSTSNPQLLEFSDGGSVPGTGNKDIIPALLTPGESVITKKATQKYGPVIDAMNNGSLPGFNKGVTGVQYFSNQSQTNPGQQVQQLLPQIMKPGELHRSHMAGMQSQVLPKSLTALINYYDNIPTNINGIPNQQRDYVGKLIISMFDDISRARMVIESGDIGETIAKEFGYKVREPDSNIKMQKIRQIIPQLTYLNPASYEHVNIGRSGQRNSYFLEAGLSDYSYSDPNYEHLDKDKVTTITDVEGVNLSKISEVSRGGEALTLKQWKEQVKRSTELINIKPPEKRLAVARILAAQYSALGKPSTGEGILSGAFDILRENKSLKKRGKLLNEEVFIQSRIEDMLSSSYMSGMKSIDDKEHKRMQSRAQSIMDELRQNGILQEFTNNRMTIDEFTGLISARLSTEKMKYRKGKKIHTGKKPWFASSVLSPNIDARGDRASFRKHVSGESRLTRVGKNKNLRNLFTFFGIDWMNDGGQSQIVPGTGNTDTVPAMLTPGEFVVNKQSTERNLSLLHAINNNDVSNIPGYNKGGFIQNFSKGEKVLSQSELKAQEGGREYLYTLLNDWVGSPVSLDEKAVTNILSTLPDVPRHKGTLYRGFYPDSSSLLPRHIAKKLDLASFSPDPELFLSSLIGEEFAMEPRSWSVSEEAADKFGLMSMTMDTPEQEGHFGLDVNKFDEYSNPGFKNEQEFIPLSQTGERVALRITGFEIKEVNGKQRIHVKTERATDISKRKRKKLERDLNSQIIARRGSVVGRRSKEKKKEKRQEVLSLTDREAGIRDEIYSWFNTLSTGSVSPPPPSFLDPEHSSIGKSMFSNYRRMMTRAVYRNLYPTEMPIMIGTNRKQTLRGFTSTQTGSRQDENNVYGANKGGLIPGIQYLNSGGTAGIMQKFANGNVFNSKNRNNVPGVGNTDTVPAMLTPGEFVINKKSTKENLALLHSINNGKVKGYNDGGGVEDNNYTIPGEGGHFTRSQRIIDLKEVKKIAEDSREAAITAGRSVKEWDDVLKSIEDKKQVEAKLYTNAIANIPKIANSDQMTGQEYSRMLESPERRLRMVDPLIDQIAKELDQSPEALRSNRSFMNAIDGMAVEIGQSLALKGGEFIDTDQFNTAFNDSINKQIKSGKFTEQESSAIERVRTRKTRAQFYVEGRKVGGRRPITSEVAAYKMGSHPSWETDFLTEEGNEKRRLANAQTEARRSAYNAAQESTETSQAETDISKRKRKRLAYEERVDIVAKKEIEKLGPAPRQPSAAAMALGSSAYETRQYEQYQNQVAQIRRSAEEDVQRDIQRSREQRSRDQIREQGRINSIRIAQERDRFIQEGMSRQEAEQQAKGIVFPGITAQPQTEQRYMDQDTERVRQRRGGRIGERIERNSGKLFAAGSGLQMASMIPFSMQNEQGQFMGMNAGMLGGGMAAAGTLAEFSPLIMKGITSHPVIAGLALAAAAVGAGLWKWRDTIDNAARESAKLGANMGGTANALGNMAEILGQADPLSKRKYTQLAVKPQEEQEFSQYAQKLKEEPGQKFIQELKSATSEERLNKLSDYLRNAVASDMLNKDQAQLFAKAVGFELGDQLLAIRAGAAVKSQQTGPTALLKIAQEKEKKTLENKGIKNVLTAEEGATLDIADASMTIGAGTQIIKAYNQAIANAEESYRNQTIGIEEYNKVIKDATEATAKWSTAITTATQNSSDIGLFGSNATAQAAITAMDLAGVSEEIRTGINDLYNDQFAALASTDTAGTQGGLLPKIMSFLPGGFLSAEAMKLSNVYGPENLRLDNEAAFKKVEAQAQETGYGGGVEGVQAFAQKENIDVVRKAFEEANAYGKEVAVATTGDAFKSVIEQLVAGGQDAASVAAQAQAIFNDPIALKAFNEAGKTVEAFAKALDIANSTILFSSDEFRQKYQKVLDQFISPEYKNAITAYVSQGATEEERKARFNKVQSVGGQVIVAGKTQQNYVPGRGVVTTTGKSTTLPGLVGQARTEAQMNYLDMKTISDQYYDTNTTQSLLDTAQKQGMFNQRKIGTSNYGSYGMGVASTGYYQFDDTKVKEYNKAIEEAGKAGVTEQVLNYSIRISGKEEKDPAQVLKDLTTDFTNLKQLDPVVLASLNIDLNKGEDLQQFGDDVESIQRGWGMLSALNPNIDMTLVASAVLKDGEGNIIDDPVVAAKNILEINEAYAQLEKSSSKSSKVSAQIRLAQAFIDDQGNKEVKPEDVVKNANKTLKDIGKSINDLPAEKASMVLQIQSDLEIKNAERNEKILEYTVKMNQALKKGTEAGNAEAYKYARMISELQTQGESAAEDAQARILAIGASDTGGSGGGGNAANPFKDLKKSIMDRLKMFTDIERLLKKFKGQKNAFMKAIEEASFGGGIADKLRKLNLDERLVQDIISQGVEASKKILAQLSKKRELAKSLNLGYIKGMGAQALDQMKSETIVTRGQITATRKMQNYNKTATPGKEISQSVMQQIAASPDLSAWLNTSKAGSKTWKDILSTVKESIKAQAAFAYDQDPLAMQEKLLDIAKRKHDLAMIPKKNEIKELEDELEIINKQIAAIERLNEKDSNRIRTLQRQKELIQRNIDALQETISAAEHQNELDQRKIESLNRQDELRKRIADAISHDLDIMSIQEQDIQDTYDKRIEALDKIQQINENITNQQRSQLNLAQALSTGDVYAAAQAQQEMQAQQSQFANQQMRTGLQTGMENQIAGLTTSGGLTRVQAEQQLNQIQQQSYQTSLQIRDIEDVIYQRNLDLLPLKDQIYNYQLAQRDIDTQIVGIQDTIYGRETDILRLKEDQLIPLDDQLEYQRDILQSNEDAFDQYYNATMARIEGLRITEEEVAAAGALGRTWINVAEAIRLANEQYENTKTAIGPRPTFEAYSGDFEAYGKALTEWDKKIKDARKTRDEKANAAQQQGKNEYQTKTKNRKKPKGNFSGGIVTNYEFGGFVPGNGSRDSVPAMLAPKEFVMTRSAVSKYGAGTFEKMNMGSFSMPKYNEMKPAEMSVQNISPNTNISAPVYNTYSINVPVNQPGATADEIANKVMTKIRSVDNMSVRSFRGY